MTGLLLPVKALFLPTDGVAEAVAKRQWLGPLILVAALTAASGAALGVRLDAARQVIPELTKSGEIGKVSEREITEKVEQAQRLAIVVGVARGVFLVPFEALMLAVALKLLAWLLGKKALFVECITAASVALLPVALYSLVTLVAALKADVVTPGGLSDLVPTSAMVFASGVGPKAERALRAVDFIALWGAVLLGLGFAAAARIKALAGAVLGVVLYALFAGAVLVGLPGLMSQGGP